MQLRFESSSVLETRIAEALMGDLVGPCDLGVGIEVVHDVDSVEIEMDCDLDDSIETDDVAATIKFCRETNEELMNTLKFAREASDPDDRGTQPFTRFSAPYERIELQLDSKAFVRVTNDELPAAQLAAKLPDVKPSAALLSGRFARATFPQFGHSLEPDTLPFAPFDPLEIQAAAKVVVAKAHQVRATGSQPGVRNVEVETVPFATQSAPYERIDIQHDVSAPTEGRAEGGAREEKPVAKSSSRRVARVVRAAGAKPAVRNPSGPYAQIDIQQGGKAFVRTTAGELPPGKPPASNTNALVLDAIEQAAKANARVEAAVLPVITSSFVRTTIEQAAKANKRAATAAPAPAAPRHQEAPIVIKPEAAVAKRHDTSHLVAIEPFRPSGPIETAWFAEADEVILNEATPLATTHVPTPVARRRISGLALLVGAFVLGVGVGLALIFAI